MWTQAIDDPSNLTALNGGLLGKECLETPIKFIWSFASNTLINQHSDINRTKNILSDEKKCEMIVVIDNMMTASARFADILLPATSSFEESDLCYQSYGMELGALVLRQNGRLVTRAGADLEHGVLRGEVEQVRHQRDDVGLRDRLAMPDGQRMVGVGVPHGAGRDEAVPLHAADGLQHGFVEPAGQVQRAVTPEFGDQAGALRGVVGGIRRIGRRRARNQRGDGKGGDRENAADCRARGQAAFTHVSSPVNIQAP